MTPQSPRSHGNPINRARGEAVRRALLAIARRAHSEGLPMPTRARLAPVLGCCEEQVWRHWRRLVADGAITIAPERPKHRLLILEVRP
jgi:hypothetical protein